MNHRHTFAWMTAFSRLLPRITVTLLPILFPAASRAQDGLYIDPGPQLASNHWIQCESKSDYTTMRTSLINFTFALADLDRNGRISPDELSLRDDTYASGKKLLTALDADADGMLSWNELNADLSAIEAKLGDFLDHKIKASPDTAASLALLKNTKIPLTPSLRSVIVTACAVRQERSMPYQPDANCQKLERLGLLCERPAKPGIPAQNQTADNSDSGIQALLPRTSSRGRTRSVYGSEPARVYTPQPANDAAYEAMRDFRAEHAGQLGGMGYQWAP